MSFIAPRSLFGRMVWVLLTGLIVAQLLSMAIHRHERSRTVARTNSLMAAQRIRDIVKLLDTVHSDSRKLIVDVFRKSDFHVTLEKGDTETMSGDWRNELHNPFLRPALHDLLGVNYSPNILTSGTDPQTFRAQVHLQDGSRVDIQFRLADETVSWPSHMLLQLLILVSSVLGLSLIAVRWVTRPLLRLANAAEELGKDIHRAPLDESGPVEVIRAAHAFNTMQARLGRYIQDRTRLLAAISHDLKTPITRLRLRTELLDDPILREKFEKDLDEMESMVIATLDFMRGADQQETVQPLDIMALLESLQADAQEMKHKVTISGTALSPFPGKPLALKRCINNLIDNAVKYGQNATIQIQDNDNQLTLIISDQGSGIPEEQLEQVFEPFYRLEGSRNRDSGGTGLGLSIARNIAQAHGGTLVLKNAQHTGLEAILTLSRHRDIF
ncbi:MAG: ATP-binding protein [Methylococcaceae bacterium]